MHAFIHIYTSTHLHAILYVCKHAGMYACIDRCVYTNARVHVQNTGLTRLLMCEI